MLKPETIKANTPISHKKSELFIDLANLYNALVGSQKLTELFTPKMRGISDEIEKFQEGAWLHSKPIDPADGSTLSQVAAKLIPCHRRKRSLFTNLVAFVNAAGESNELGDLSVSSTEMDKGLVEYGESLKNLEATLFRVTNGIIVPSEEDAKELAENIVQPTNEDEPTDSNDENTQGSDGYDYTLAVKFKTDNYLNVGQLQGLEYALKQALSDIADDLGVEVDITNYTIC